MQLATARAWSATDCSAVATPAHASCTAAAHTSRTSCGGIWLTERGGCAPGADAVIFLADGSENGGGSSAAPACPKREGHRGQVVSLLGGLGVRLSGGQGAIGGCGPPRGR